MSSQPNNESEPQAISDDIYGWKWFIAYGAGYMVLSGLLIAHMVVSDMISTFIIGAVMLIAAALGFGHAGRVRDPDTHDCWTLSGLLYSLCAIAVLMEPFIGGRLLTLALAAGLLISGLSRIVAGAQLKSTPVLISGTATVIIGTVIGVDWKEHLLWIVAYGIAADLVVQGVTLLVAGEELHLRRPLGPPVDQFD